MAETKISWTHTRTADGRLVPGYTFNPWIGCMKVSPACDGCYAENLMAYRYKRVEWGAPGVGIGTRSRTSASNWYNPIRWNKKAAIAETRPFVFCASLSDVFDKAVPVNWRRDLFLLIRSTPHLVWMLLTKRPQNIIAMSADAGGLPENVALGTTCEDQKRWDINVPALIEAKWELKPLFAFVSAEPLLGEIRARAAPIPFSLKSWFRKGALDFDPLSPAQHPLMRIDQIITGGESDQGTFRARPSNPQWYRYFRDDCAATGTVYHHKQNGEWVSVSEVAGEGEHFTFPDGRTVRRIGAAKSGRTIDGVEHLGHFEVAA
ncbi:DUF5131 family protein [Mesorhizobium huakuii]|uniref:DUF5131 family protein n=1 Tax=Mesorhizobium huakuii TaxID=28104 RepID=UPI001FD1B9AD|nr:DUF5131 family protein [Mesorhizobium huakuii]